MILALITAWLAYKKATENGRNGILWAIIGAGVFIGTQLLVSVAIGVFLGTGVGLWGWSETVYETYSILITIAALIASFFTSWLLLKFLDKNPEIKNTYTPPPSPPRFD